MFGIQFYPTPLNLVSRMLDKVDFSRVKFALEPSAGKGDLAQGIGNRLKGKPHQIDCVEIDADLRAVLKERGHTVIGNDFLKWDGKTRYDLIAANPPFSNGDKHFLHMLEIMKNGGQIVCLLNATTITDADSPVRQDIMHRLAEYDADVEIIRNAFQDAERKANVDCALVYVDIPRQEERDVLANLKESLQIPNAEPEECQDLVDGNIFAALVRQYDFEAKLGLQIIDDFKQYGKYVPAPKEDTSRTGSLLSLEVNNRESENKGLSQQNQYIRELRYRYWATLFERKEMQPLMTREVRSQYHAKLNSLRSYDFTMDNILQIKIDLSQALIGNIEDAIMKMFNDLTYEHSMGKNTNIHYYNGWKTNKASKVNSKVIKPIYGLFDSRWCASWDIWKAADYLEELEKILGYLDSGRTDGANYDEIIKAQFNRKTYSGERIPCKFFDVSFKKKGTVHVWFTDDALLKKFNIFGGRNKNWLPGDYGAKPYENLDRDEKAVVDAFEGKQSYAETHSAKSFFIQAPQFLMLNETN